MIGMFQTNEFIDTFEFPSTSTTMNNLVNCRPTTILTNLQRGNVRTRLAPESTQTRSVFERAARGELLAHELLTDQINCIDRQGYTALMWASAHGQLNSVRILLTSGADVNTHGPNGESSLLLAAANGHVHVLRDLLKAGACVDDADQDGTTALMFAAAGDHADLATELLRANADLARTNVQGDSAYSIACRSSRRCRIAIERRLLSLLQTPES
jgi:ankyrin repeat protein